MPAIFNSWGFEEKSLGKATGFEDKTQGTLFFDVCRIPKAKRPKVFISLSNSTKMIIAGKLVRRDDEWLFLQEHSECGARSIEEFVDSIKELYLGWVE